MASGSPSARAAHVRGSAPGDASRSPRGRITDPFKRPTWAERLRACETADEVVAMVANRRRMAADGLPDLTEDERNAATTRRVELIRAGKP